MTQNPLKQAVAWIRRRRVPAPPETVPVVKLTVAELAPYLMLSPKNRNAIRHPDEFVPVDGDLRTQVLALIDHLFVRYPVPRCLYRAMLSDEGLDAVFPGEIHPGGSCRMKRETTYRRWFHTIARGESFAFVAKEVLTKREAHWFVRSPPRLTVEECLHWSRPAAQGVPPEACEFLVARLGPYGLQDLSGRLSEMYGFFARVWKDLAPAERQEIVDYVRNAFDDPGFSLKGRTLASVRRLSAAWHDRFNDDPVVRNVSWKAGLAPWESRDGATLVAAVELTNGAALADESTVQRHCVHSYATVCQRGRSRIVSFRWRNVSDEAEIDRITLEVDRRKRTVVQIRGRRNRRASADEMATIQRWAGERKLRIDPDA